MSDEHSIELPDDLEIRFGDGSGNERYRTCAALVTLPDGGQGVCGRDCEPEHAGADGMGARIAFVCPEHGLHAVVDPFEGMR